MNKSNFQQIFIYILLNKNVFQLSLLKLNIRLTSAKTNISFIMWEHVKNYISWSSVLCGNFVSDQVNFTINSSPKGKTLCGRGLDIFWNHTIVKMLPVEVTI